MVFAGWPRLTKRIIAMIQGAEKSIRVAMFTWTRADFAKEIIAAHKRGITVQIALDRNSAQGASSKIATLFKENGIPVTLNKGTGLLHHKLLVIDDRILVNGSANWTKAAFTQNEDCFMILYELTDKQREKLKTVWEGIEK